MQNKITRFLMLIVLILTVAIVPIMIKVAIVPRTLLEIDLVGGPEEIIDTFSFYKSRFIIFFGVLLTLLFLNVGANKLIKGHSFDYKSFFKKFLNVAMVLYIALIILSTIFSPYSEIALKGASERYENVFVLLSYCILFFAVIYAVKTEKHAEYLLYGFFFSAFIIGIIGTMQFFNHDPFNMEGFKNFILGDIRNSIKNYSTNITTVFSTLYNPNCAGMYGAMMFLLTLSIAVLAPLKSPVKYIAAVLSPVILLVLVGSYSLAGIIGALCGAIAFIIICTVYLFSHRSKIGFTVIITTVVMIIGLAALSQIPYFKKEISLLVSKANNSFFSKDVVIYDYIRIDDNIAEISIHKNVLYLEYDRETDAILIKNSNKDIVEPSDITTNEGGGSLYTYSTNEINNFQTERNGNVVVFSYVTIFPFGIYDNGSLTALNAAMKPFDINEPIPSIGFKDMQAFANSRGYIWSKSFPLLKSNILIGKGPDTYTMQFPQHDVVGKTNFYHGDSFIVIDKPHNTYLQYAINTGMLSLLAVLTIFGLYLINTLVSVAKNKAYGLLTPLQIGIFSAISAYLISSMSTDSTVSVAPIFWCLLGLGFAVNNIRQDINKLEEVKNVKGKNLKRK